MIGLGNRWCCRPNRSLPVCRPVSRSRRHGSRGLAPVNGRRDSAAPAATPYAVRLLPNRAVIGDASVAWPGIGRAWRMQRYLAQIVAPLFSVCSSSDAGPKARRLARNSLSARSCIHRLAQRPCRFADRAAVGIKLQSGLGVPAIISMPTDSDATAGAIINVTVAYSQAIVDGVLGLGPRCQVVTGAATAAAYRLHAATTAGGLGAGLSAVSGRGHGQPIRSP